MNTEQIHDHGHQTRYDSWSEFFEAYWNNFADPAHFAAEITYFIILDVLILGFAIAKINKRRIDAEHARIDAEHGHTH